MSEPERRGRGRGTPNDPQRRERILEAAARIVVRSGVDAVTFRAVAGEAGVPLGSTTYYFADKDALLLEVIALYREKSGRGFEARLVREVHDRGVVEGLARLVEVWTIDERDGFLFEHSLYLAVFRSDALREEAVRWRMTDVFEAVFDHAYAAALAYLVDGMLLSAVMMGERFPAAQVAPLVAGVIRGLDPDSPAASPLEE